MRYLTIFKFYKKFLVVNPLKNCTDVLGKNSFDKFCIRVYLPIPYF